MESIAQSRPLLVSPENLGFFIWPGGLLPGFMYNLWFQPPTWRRCGQPSRWSFSTSRYPVTDSPSSSSTWCNSLCLLTLHLVSSCRFAHVKTFLRLHLPKPGSIYFPQEDATCSPGVSFQRTCALRAVRCQYQRHNLLHKLLHLPRNPLNKHTILIAWTQQRFDSSGEDATLDFLLEIPPPPTSPDTLVHVHPSCRRVWSAPPGGQGSRQGLLMLTVSCMCGYFFVVVFFMPFLFNLHMPTRGQRPKQRVGINELLCCAQPA